MEGTREGEREGRRKEGKHLIRGFPLDMITPLGGKKMNFGNLYSFSLKVY